MLLSHLVSVLVVILVVVHDIVAVVRMTASSSSLLSSSSSFVTALTPISALASPPIQQVINVVLITGSTDGIGETTARNILLPPHTNNQNSDTNANNKIVVLIHGRDENRIRSTTESLLQAIQKQRKNNNKKKNNNSHQEETEAEVEENEVIALPASDLATMRGCYELADNVKQALIKGSDDDVTKNTKKMQLQILMNNAGVFSQELIRTEDGLEVTFAVNVVAPFIVTSMLLSSLLVCDTTTTSTIQKKTKTKKGDEEDTDDASSTTPDPNEAGGSPRRSSRIVIASSVSQSWKLSNEYWEDLHYTQRPYSAHTAYSDSKLLDAMLTMEMAHRLQVIHAESNTNTNTNTNDDRGRNTRITCNCLDPGTVNTKMLLDGWGRIGIDVRTALDETWCCTNAALETVSGQYYVGRTPRHASEEAYDIHQRTKLWHVLSQLAPEAAHAWDAAIAPYTAVSSSSSSS